MTRVLIVDDQLLFRRRLRQMLDQAGLTVVGEAVDIPTALQQVQTLQPDLAVVDVMLPGVSGLDGTPHLKATCPGLRVILVSAFGDHPQLASAAAEAGAEAFVPKEDLGVEVARAWRNPSDGADATGTQGPCSGSDNAA
jgi:DNA-binding NarL/FixJ family response regulator